MVTITGTRSATCGKLFMLRICYATVQRRELYILSWAEQQAASSQQEQLPTSSATKSVLYSSHSVVCVTQLSETSDTMTAGK